MNIRRFINRLQKRAVWLMRKGFKVLTKKDFLLIHGNPPAQLNETQQMFLQWNAERLGISFEESQERYYVSYKALSGGHHGTEYRLFNDISYQIYQVFFGDTVNELLEAYQYHAFMHFLRMLSYPEPKWEDRQMIVQILKTYKHVDILDYGCGLAQRSRSLALFLQQHGCAVTLYLADIPMIRKQFLAWACHHTQLEMIFLDCTTNTPYPNIPLCDMCFANEFFEHVYNPMQYFDAFHGALRGNGMFETTLSDHNIEFMHVSPHLHEIRNKIRILDYKELIPNKLYQKV